MSHRTLVTALLGGVCALALAACVKTSPSARPPGPIEDSPEPPAAAKAEFAAVVARYERAQEGKLELSHCAVLARDFSAVYERYPASMAVARFNAGAVWEACGRPAKAEAIYRELIVSAPRFDLAYNNLGVILWNRRQEAKALALFKTAVKINPATRAPRNNLAAALRDRYAKRPSDGDFLRAENELQNVLAVDSSNRPAYENLARLYYDRGRLTDRSYLLLADLVVTQAVEVLRETKRESADIHNIRGLIRMQQGDQAAALRAFMRAANVEPLHSGAHMNIAMISLRYRDYARAAKSLEVALKDERQRSNIEAYLGLGVARRGLRRYADAERAFKKAIAVDSADPRPLYNLGILYQEHIAPNATIRETFRESDYKRAQSYFDQFSKRAASSQHLAAAVADANARIATIEELFVARRQMEDLARRAREQAARERKQRAEERKRLLLLERKARQAQGLDTP